MGRILAIDYGKKRIGMAMTDILQISINPLPTLENAQWKQGLIEIIKNHQIEKIVFGLSTHRDGNLTFIGEEVQKIMEKLKVQYPNILFDTCDEYHSSKDATQLMILMGVRKSQRREKPRVDQTAAVIILKNYLERFKI